MLSTENIVYLLRKTNLNLKEIGELTPKKAYALLRELYFQESQETYRQQYSIATILAAIYNTIPRRDEKILEAKDFLSGDEPSREPKKITSLEILAKAKGIILPKS